MPKKKLALSNDEFLRRVRDYLPLDAVVWETDESGEPCNLALTNQLEANTFYQFNGETVRALSHALEELALDEANGRFLAATQDFEYFKANYERYWQLAATVDDVVVVGSGKAPARRRFLKFVGSGRTAFKRYWVMLYQGHPSQCLWIGRQTQAGRRLEDRLFLGFYTFDAPLIARFRREIENVLAGGGDSEPPEFKRLLAVDQTGKRLHSEFAGQIATLQRAIHKLKVNGEKYSSHHFAAELDGSLARLYRLRQELPRELRDSEGEPL